MAQQNSFFKVFLPIVKSYNYFQIGYYGGGYSSIDEKCNEAVPELFKDDSYFKFLDVIPDGDKQQVAEELAACMYRYNYALRQKLYREKIVKADNDINNTISKDLEILQKFNNLVEYVTHDYYTVHKDDMTGLITVKESGKGQVIAFVKEMERVLREKDFGGLIEKNKYYKEVPIPHSTKKELKNDLHNLFNKYKLKEKQLRIRQIVEELQTLNP